MSTLRTAGEVETCVGGKNSRDRRVQGAGDTAGLEVRN